MYYDRVQQTNLRRAANLQMGELLENVDEGASKYCIEKDMCAEL
jgi:hypothetical protein